MDSLTQALNSLTYEDGTPDIQARMSALNNLALALTPQEVRRLRSQLNVWQWDALSEFPIEVLLLIMEYLELEDIVRLRMVSREWRKKWTSPHVSMKILQMHFPSKYRDYLRQSKDEQETLKETLHQSLPRTIKDRLNRHYGQWESFGAYLYMNSSPHSLEDQYHSGRIAFRYKPYSILVWTLRPSSTHFYKTEQLVKIELGWVLSNRFLVGQTILPTSLVAWSLHDCSMVTVRLPSKAVSFSVLNDQVAILFSTTKVLIWSIGGSLKTVDISAAEAHMSGFHIALPSVLFYPGSARDNDNSHFFLVCQASLKTSIGEPVKHKVKLVIAEFANCQHKAIHSLNQLWEGPEAFLPGKVSIIDDDGLCCISWEDRIMPSYPSAVQVPNTCHHRGYLGNPVFDRIVLVTFNMNTGEFAARSHHIPTFVIRGANDFKTRLDPVHIWRNQVLLPAFSTTLGNMPGSPDTALVAIDCCDRLSQMERLEIPSYETVSGSIDERLILNDKMLPHKFGITHCWIGGKRFDEKELDVRNITCIVQGDDDFIVLFLQQEILIWYFEGQPSLVQFPTI